MNNKALGIILITTGAIWALARTGAIQGPNFLIALGAILIAAYFATGYRLGLLVAGSIVAAIGLFADLGGEGYLFFIFLGGAFITVYIVERLLNKDSGWALYPAAGLIGFGIFILFVENEHYAAMIPTLWPIVLIALGLLLLIPRR